MKTMKTAVQEIFGKTKNPRTPSKEAGRGIMVGLGIARQFLPTPLMQNIEWFIGCLDDYESKDVPKDIERILDSVEMAIEWLHDHPNHWASFKMVVLGASSAFAPFDDDGDTEDNDENAPDRVATMPPPVNETAAGEVVESDWDA